MRGVLAKTGVRPAVTPRSTGLLRSALPSRVARWGARGRCSVVLIVVCMQVTCLDMSRALFSTRAADHGALAALPGGRPAAFRHRAAP